MSDHLKCEYLDFEEELANQCQERSSVVLEYECGCIEGICSHHYLSRFRGPGVGGYMCLKYTLRVGEPTHELSHKDMVKLHDPQEWG